jgi:hypothetical protein
VLSVSCLLRTHLIPPDLITPVSIWSRLQLVVEFLFPRYLNVGGRTEWVHRSLSSVEVFKLSALYVRINTMTEYSQSYWRSNSGLKSFSCVRTEGRFTLSRQFRLLKHFLSQVSAEGLQVERLVYLRSTLADMKSAVALQIGSLSQ